MGLCSVKGYGMQFFIELDSPALLASPTTKYISVFFILLELSIIVTDASKVSSWNEQAESTDNTSTVSSQ